MTESDEIRQLTLIWAMSEDGVIGADGGLPWSLPDDLAHFKRLTQGHPVIMGRRTWDSLWIKPLPNRLNIVVTRNREFVADGAEVVGSVQASLDMTAGARAFCIGGGVMFDNTLAVADRLEVTVVHIEIEGDTHMPYIDWDHWVLVHEELHPADDRHEYAFTFRTYDRV